MNALHTQAIWENELNTNITIHSPIIWGVTWAYIKCGNTYLTVFAKRQSFSANLCQLWRDSGEQIHFAPQALLLWLVNSVAHSHWFVSMWVMSSCTLLANVALNACTHKMHYMTINISNSSMHDLTTLMHQEVSSYHVKKKSFNCNLV